MSIHQEDATGRSEETAFFLSIMGFNAIFAWFQQKCC